MLQNLYENVASATLTLTIHVQGLRSLLTHNPESMGAESPQAKRGSRIPEAQVEAENGVYRLSDGSCGIKGEAFRKAIVTAASAWRAKRSSMKSQLAHIVVVPELITLLDPQNLSPLKNYEIDARRAIVQKQGIIRRRPRFDDWAAIFKVEYDSILIPNPKMIVDICADAGNRIGVGDYRPACSGFFGRFQVVSYEFSI